MVGAEPNRDLQFAVRREQARALADALPGAAVGSLFSAAVVTWVVQSQATTDGAAVAFGLYLLIQLLRMGFAQELRRRGLIDRSPLLFMRATVIGSLLSGLWWAVTPLMTLSPSADARATLTTVFAAVGTAAGAVALGNALAANVFAFTLPTLAGVAVLCYLDASSESAALLVSTFLFTAVIGAASLRAERLFVRSAIILAERTAMTDSLTRANARTQAAVHQFEFLAKHDPLTGLLNRSSMSDRFGDRLATARATGGRVGVALLDIDHFKQVNDVLGHPTGDRLLIEAAERLRVAVGPDEVGRLGGDEFAVLYQLAPGEEPGALADRVLAAFAAPFTLADRPAAIGVSIGLAVSPDHGSTVDDLMSRADLALYAAKERGRRRWALYDERLGDRARDDRELEADLRAAIRTREIAYAFQPQISIAECRVIGFEALVRWRHPTRGPVSPELLVAAAHRCDQAGELLELALDSACEMVEQLDRRGYPGMRVAVNVSPRDFVAFDVAALVTTVLSRHRVASSSLEIEITEDAMLDFDLAGPQLERLERLGVPLAVDDFGVGYSSLARLRDLKIDRLKIDRRFVQGISDGHSDRALFEAITAVGKSLGIELVAEGIETYDQLEAVARLGCDVAQGYLFAPALSQADALAWVGAVVAKPRASTAVRSVHGFEPVALRA